MRSELSLLKKRRRRRETGVTQKDDDDDFLLELFDDDGNSQGIVGNDDAWVPPHYNKRYYSQNFAPPPYTDGDSVAIATLDDSAVDAVRRQLAGLNEEQFDALLYDGDMADILRLNRTSAASIKDVGNIQWYGPFSRDVDRLVVMLMDLEPNHSQNTVPSTLHYVLCKVLEQVVFAVSTPVTCYRQ